MRRKAKNIHGRNMQLFVGREDIEWAILVHATGLASLAVDRGYHNRE